MTPLLEIDDLTVEYRLGRGRPPLRAADGVSLAIAEEETVGLVGESGSGKTTVGRAVLGRAPISAGAIRFDGEDITDADRSRRRSLSSAMQVVFQNPYGSLNPARTVGQTIGEMLRPHGRLARADVDARVADMLERVGLPADAAARYPAQFSGGQRQRIAIARALIVQPRLVICDEPVSALDISVQAQILNLLGELQQTLRLSYLFISHDLAIVRHIAQRVVVLYRGRIVEEGASETVLARPAHPYTALLVAAAPVPDPDVQRRRRAQLPTQAALAEPEVSRDSCLFAARCPLATDLCRSLRPPLEPVDGGHAVACHHWRELSATTNEETTTCAYVS